jgi:hypothetical protein
MNNMENEFTGGMKRITTRRVNKKKKKILNNRQYRVLVSILGIVFVVLMTFGLLTTINLILN